MNKGYLITLEGIEGCGKTTQAKMLYDYFANKNLDTILTYEPGATKIGKIIRKILLSIENRNINSYTELYLYLADRAQHLSEVIYPNYKKGKIIICDRYCYSSIVYQGIVRGIGVDIVNQLHSQIPFFIVPDVTFVIDITVDESMKRIKRRISSNKESELIRFETEEKLFHEKIRKGYLDLYDENPLNVILIDGMKDINQIHLEIVNYLRLKGIIKS